MADPPYDMRERQRQQSPQPSPPSFTKGDNEEKRRDLGKTISERDRVNDDGADRYKGDKGEVGSASSTVEMTSGEMELTVDHSANVVESLLTLAAASLRPQGRVVFFYPHRHSRLTSELTSMAMTSSSPASSSTAATSSTGNSNNNPTNNKIHKRKAFRDAIRQRPGLAQPQAQTQGLVQTQTQGLVQTQTQGLGQDQSQGDSPGSMPTY